MKYNAKLSRKFKKYAKILDEGGSISGVDSFKLADILTVVLYKLAQIDDRTKGK